MINLFYQKKIFFDKAEFELIILHDFWDYHKYYLPFVEGLQKLTGQKVSFRLIDFTGFGLSGGSRGHFDSVDRQCEEIYNSLNTETSPKNKKRIILGQGLGALLALRLYQVYALDKTYGLILANPCLGWEKKVPLEIDHLISSFSKTWSKAKVPWFPKMESLTNNKITRLELEKDALLCRKISVKLYSEVSKYGTRALDYGAFLDIPILLLKSNEQQFYSNEDLELFSQGIGPHLLCRKEYSFKDHLIFQSEALNDIILDINKWLEQSLIGL